MEGMRRLQDAGIVGHVGVSNFSADRWEAAEHDLGRPVVSNQVHFSLLQRKPDRANVPYAQAHDRVVIAYSPLEQGVLGGRYDAEHLPPGPARRNNPLCLPANLERATPVLENLRRVAKAHDATPAQVALALEQLEHNVAAADLQLTDDEADELTSDSDQFAPISRPATGIALLRSRRSTA
jgi:aryl-alcohol dehydrogenase-like predicted oxidoreductase